MAGLIIRYLELKEFIKKIKNKIVDLAYKMSAWMSSKKTYLYSKGQWGIFLWWALYLIWWAFKGLLCVTTGVCIIFP